MVSLPGAPAAGGWGGGGLTNEPAPGSSVPGVQASDPGPISAAAGGWGGGGLTNEPAPGSSVPGVQASDPGPAANSWSGSGPRSFRDDGAAGAGGSTTGYNTDGGATPSPSAPTESSGSSSSGAVAPGSAVRGIPGSAPSSSPSYQTAPSPKGISMPTAVGAQDTTGLTPWTRQFLQNTGGFMSYSEGGAISDDDEGNGSPDQDAIQRALQSVDGVLAFGRKLHGLGGGDEEDGGAIKGTQMAQNSYQNNRMPAIPGNPSDSGIKPIQPEPGPLPPTSNPFGKRADASDNDQDDQGAISTDEDNA